MLTDARDFNNIETGTVNKFFFPTRQVGEGNLSHSERNIRKTCTIVFYRQERTSTRNMATFPSVLRPALWSQRKATQEIIEKIHELILEDRRILPKSIAEQWGI